MNRICEVLQIQHPVIQGPMAWITSSKLAAAVSNAGGLGVLGTSADSTEIKTSIEDTVAEMRTAIRSTRALTDKPFGVNVFPEAVDPFGFSKAIIQLMKEENVKVMVLAGTAAPDEILQLKADGFTIIYREMNPTVRGAVEAERAGVDMIVATGCDEGGCMPCGSTGTMAIVSLLADAVSIPVLAAGGIINGKMAAAVKALGAEGVFAGTRFILSDECRAADSIKETILNTHPDDFIVFEQMGGLSKWRTVPNKIGRDGLEENRKGNKNPGSGSFYNGMFRGDVDGGVITVCNTAPLAKKVVPCSEIVAELAAAFAEP